MSCLEEGGQVYRPRNQGEQGREQGGGPQHSEIPGTQLHFQCDSPLLRPGTSGLPSLESDLFSARVGEGDCLAVLGGVLRV